MQHPIPRTSQKTRTTQGKVYLKTKKSTAHLEYFSILASMQCFDVPDGRIALQQAETTPETRFADLSDLRHLHRQTDFIPRRNTQ
jgi:hypothetical protein